MRSNPLTIRQNNILILLINGYTPKEMPSIVGVSYASIKYDLAITRAALNAKTTTQALAIAIRKGYININNLDID